MRWEEAMFRLLGFMFVLCLVGQPSFGDDSNRVFGTWKLVSYETEVQATGEKEPAMGQNRPAMLPSAPRGACSPS